MQQERLSKVPTPPMQADAASRTLQSPVASFKIHTCFSLMQEPIRSPDYTRPVAESHTCHDGMSCHDGHDPSPFISL